MSRLSSQQLLAGLSQIGTGTTTRADTPAYLHFTATNADLSDITPLKHYPYLQQIDLSHNSLDSLSVLSGCASLRSLNVSYNRLPTLLEFAAPRGLENVDYSHNNLTKLGEYLKTNKYLKSLDLSVNRLEELAEIASLQQLTNLNVARNQLTSLADITCPNLLSLDASGNFIKDCLSLSTELRELRHLKLDENQIASLEGIESAVSLTSLSLASNQILSLDEVARLSSLDLLIELDLRGNPLASEDDYRVRLLHILPNLEKLDGVAVEAKDIVQAHNAHGADSGMREAIARLYLPKDEATKRHEGVRPVATLGQQSTSDTAATAHNIPCTILPESEFWSLLAERGFISEWKEWLRLAKARLPESRPNYGTEGDDQTAEELTGRPLDLNGINIGEAGCWAIAELLAVRGGHAISSLDLAYAFHPSRWSSKLSDSYGIRTLFTSFSHLTHLKSLRLSHCHLGRDGGILLSGYLATPSARSLKSLHLAHNLLGSNLTATAQTDGQLYTIESCPGLRAILSALIDRETPAELDYLDLSSNSIDQLGSQVIADYLVGRIPTPPTSTTSHASSRANLHVASNDSATTGDGYDGEQLTEEDQPFQPQPIPTNPASTLHTPPQLRSLLLNSNPLSDDGVTTLSYALRVNQSLTYLSLRGDSDRSISRRGLASLSLSLSRYNRSIRKLDLSENKRLFGFEDAPDSEQEEAGRILGSILYHATNGTQNEASTILEELILENTGLTSKILVTFSKALSLNSTLLRLNLSNNSFVTELGQDVLFSALAQPTSVLEELQLGGWSLGQKSALRAAEWLKNSGTIRVFTTTSPNPRTIKLQPETEAAGFAPEVDEAAGAVEEDATPANELSELVLSTLSASFTQARSRDQLKSIGLRTLGEHLDVVVSNLAVTLTKTVEDLVLPSPVQEFDENGELIEPEVMPSPETQTSTVETGLLQSLDLSSNTWDVRSFESLIQLVQNQNQLQSLTLRYSTFSDDVLANAEDLFGRLFSTILASGSISSLDFSNSTLNIAVLDGIGSGLLGPDGLGANSTLLSLDLSNCSLDGFSVGEDTPSKFLQSLSADGNNLATLLLRGNDLRTPDLQQLLTVLDNNWALRSLDLSANHLHGVEDSLLLLRGLVSHSISHGFQRLALPFLKHTLGGGASTGGVGTGALASSSTPNVRDRILQAISRGWTEGVERATNFIAEQGRTPESVLHTLKLELGDATFESMSWSQKQLLLEAIRPFKQLQTTRTQESFRLVQLTAAGKPIRVNTQPMTCGIDLIENALAARLAAQRM